MSEALLHLAGLAELLLALAMLVSVRAWAWLYAAQCTAIALAAAAAALQAADPAAVASVPILLLQAAAVPRLLRIPPDNPAPPLPTLPAGLALCALALSAPLPGAYAAPLAMLLLGLLAAATRAGQRTGPLLLLNGASAAASLAPGGWIAVLVLALLAACDRLRWAAPR